MKRMVTLIGTILGSALFRPIICMSWNAVETIDSAAASSIDTATSSSAHLLVFWTMDRFAAASVVCQIVQFQQKFLTEIHCFKKKKIRKGLFEGLKAHRRGDGRGFLLFRLEENAKRMQMGAERMCMPSPSTDQFVHAVKQTVLANKRWVRIQIKI